MRDANGKLSAECRRQCQISLPAIGDWSVKLGVNCNMDARRMPVRGGAWPHKLHKSASVPVSFAPVATLPSTGIYPLGAPLRRGLPPRAVVVGDMQVAESSSDEEECVDAGILDHDKGDGDNISHARIVRVVTHGSKILKEDVSSADSEPSWHALLRRTPSGRTASITRTSPRAPRTPLGLSAGGQGLHLSPARIPSNAPSRIIRTDGPQRPPVNIPAKVLVPSAHSRLLLRADPRARVLGPLRTRGRLLVSGAGRPDAGDACGNLRLFGSRAKAVVIPSPVDPFTSAESSILDGVLDMMEEQKLNDVQAVMRIYGVTGDDTLPDVGPLPA